MQGAVMPLALGFLSDDHIVALVSAAMSGSQLQLDVLELLAEQSPKSYLSRRASGQSVLRELYAQAAEAQLVPPSSPNSDDILRLHALFDVALDHGMGGLVLDYIAEVRPLQGLLRAKVAAAAAATATRRHPPSAAPDLPLTNQPLLAPSTHHSTLQVCSDRLLISSDPVDSLLLDGECVRRWAHKLLAVSRGRLASWLARGLGAASVGGAGASDAAH
jgi:E3 ubiquitin-protein ligase HOS1